MNYKQMILGIPLATAMSLNPVFAQESPRENLESALVHCQQQIESGETISPETRRYLIEDIDAYLNHNGVFFSLGNRWFEQIRRDYGEDSCPYRLGEALINYSRTR